MATIKQVENTLKALGVEIQDIQQDKGGVKEVTGTLNNKRYRWNRSGVCFRNNVHYKAMDIKFK